MATTIVKFHVLLYSIMAHGNACFQRSTKALKFCPCIFHLSSSTTQLNGFRSSVELLSTISILWHLLLDFTKPFIDNTCRSLTVWDANVWLVNIVPKHGNIYLKCDYLKSINLLIFFFLLWCYIFSLGSVVKFYTVIWIELHMNKNLFRN